MRWLVVAATLLASPRADACESGTSQWYDRLLAPALASMQSGTVVTWHHNNPRTSDVEGARLAAGSDPELPDVATAGSQPDVAAGDDGALVVWSGGGIFAAPFDRLDEPVQIASTGTSPKLAWAGTHYVVVWTAGSAVELAWLDRSGHIESTQTLAAASGAWRRTYADVAWLAGTTLVVWSESGYAAPSEEFDIVGLRVGVDAAPIAITAAPKAEAYPVVAASATQFLVGWVGDAYIECCDPRYSHVDFARVDVDGTVVDTTPLASWPTMVNSQPSLASSGASWLATWNHDGVLSSAVIGANESSVTVVGQSVGWTHDLAWDGEHYVAAYQRERDTYTSDIYAVWLDKRGALVVDETPIATGHDSAGCGCSTHDPAAAWPLVVALGALRRRRATISAPHGQTGRRQGHRSGRDDAVGQRRLARPDGPER